MSTYEFIVSQRDKPRKAKMQEQNNQTFDDLNLMKQASEINLYFTSYSTLQADQHSRERDRGLDVSLAGKLVNQTQNYSHIRYNHT